jgi:hypothetical protein
VRARRRNFPIIALSTRDDIKYNIEIVRMLQSVQGIEHILNNESQRDRFLVF